jgi:hypothetical protein
MKSIEHLHLELHAAKERNLIISFEQINNRDIILVELKKNTPLNVCHALQLYINKTYNAETTLKWREKLIYIQHSCL